MRLKIKKREDMRKRLNSELTKPTFFISLCPETVNLIQITYSGIN